MNRSGRQEIKSQWDEERPGFGTRVLLHCGALSKAGTCWKRPRFQALDAAAKYHILTYLDFSVPAFPTCSLLHLSHPP